MKDEQKRLERELKRMYWMGWIALVAYILIVVLMAYALIHFIIKFW